VFQSVPTEMAVYSQFQRDGLTGGALAICLLFAAGGCCELLQPTRVNNPGFAAYKPATVIAYGPSSGLPPPPDVYVPQPITTDNLASELETNCCDGAQARA
jgi:hypothetical protein